MKAGGLLGMPLAGPVWVQAPEANVEDLSLRAEQGLLSSQGCVILDVAVEQELHQRGRRTVLVGRVRAELEQGTWRPRGLVIDRQEGAPTLVDFGDGLPLLLPIMGRHTRPDGSPLESSYTQGLLALLTDQAQSEEVGRDEAGGLQLRRTFEARGGLGGAVRENVLVATFDEALRPRSWTVDVDLPVRGAAGRIRRMALVLEVDEDGVPVREMLDLQIGAGTRVVRQAVVRRAGLCAAEGG